MTTSKGFLPVTEYEQDETEHRRQLARAINRLNGGKFNCTVDLTLRASQTTTTLTDARIGAFSFLDFMPTTANAATAKANIYVTDRMKGSCTVNHSSSANTDQTFVVGIFG